MSMIPIKPKVYDDGRTKQSFKDQTDINKILKRAQRTGALSHLEKFGGQYGDLSDFDFQEAQNQLAKAKEIFDALPSEVRKEFGNQPGNFFEYANDPKNTNKLAELLPDLAKPGFQTPNVVRTAVTEGAVGAQEARSAAPDTTTPVTPETPAGESEAKTQ